jgi:hypothetical protein
MQCLKVARGGSGSDIANRDVLCPRPQLAQARHVKIRRTNR